MNTTSTAVNDEDQIRAVIADRAAAMHDRDAERFTAHYAPQMVKFDDVIASLVLHYLEDWGPTLTELRRVLRDGGRLIVALDHPLAIQALNLLAGRRTSYLATYSWSEEWTMDSQTAR